VIAQGRLGVLGRLGRIRTPARGGGLGRGRSGRARRSPGRMDRLPRVTPRRLVACSLLTALLIGGWFWLRDSSLVAVKRVSVTGVSGPDAGRVRSALIAAARNMTTLDVNVDQLNTAVAPYPVVKSLQVDSQFPHGLRIRVVEEIPIGTVQIAGRNVAVAGDGTLLHDAAPGGQLPVIPLRVTPGGPRIRSGADLQLVDLLAAAPYQLLAHVSRVATIAPHGLVAELRNGPAVYFGDATQLRAKWLAASAVLAENGSVGAEYIDVTDPQRPAAGAGTRSASSSGATSSTSSPIASGATSSTSSPIASGTSSSSASSTSPPAASTSSPSTTGAASGGG
jgi:cell division protein FtsQ